MIIAYRQTYSHNCFVRWQWPVLALLKTHNLDVLYLMQFMSALIVSMQAILIVHSKYLVVEGFSFQLSFPFAEVITCLQIGTAFDVTKRIW